MKLTGLSATPLSEWCAQASVFNPIAYTGICLPYDVSKVSADVYGRVQYGHIPTPAELPLPPAPNAPQTVEEMTIPGAWTPEQGFPTLEQYQAFTASQRQALADAEASGAWNPQGNLPVSELDLQALWDEYKIPLMLIGGSVIGLVIYSSVKR